MRPAHWLIDKSALYRLDRAHFDPVPGLDTAELFTFAGATLGRKESK